MEVVRLVSGNPISGKRSKVEEGVAVIMVR